jgi:hypothetical protein
VRLKLAPTIDGDVTSERIGAAYRRINAMISDRTIVGSVCQATIKSAKSGSVGQELADFTMAGASDSAVCDVSPDEFAIRSSPAGLIVSLLEKSRRILSMQTFA